jgi:RNA-directed DNA polymerase
MNGKSLEDLSRMFNPVLRGWLNYYGRFHRSALYCVWQHMDAYLTRWLMRKYKRLARHKTRAWRRLDELKAQNPNAFVHWQLRQQWLNDGSRMS